MLRRLQISFTTRISFDHPFEPENVIFTWQALKPSIPSSCDRLGSAREVGHSRHPDWITQAARDLVRRSCSPSKAFDGFRSKPRGFDYSMRADRRRSEFPITLTDDSAIAAAAIAGDKVSPKKG